MFETVQSPSRESPCDAISRFFRAHKYAGKKKDKYKDLPPDLADAWARDRAKKAERKEERELQRLLAAADPMAKKKGGKKGRKAMRRAAAMDPAAGLMHQVFDMVSLEREVRRFVINVGGPDTIALPPMTKDERKKVHELATAFKLKSNSKGKGADRYTTLVKTTRSGIMVDERKVSKLLNGVELYVKGGKRGAPIHVPKHREGEEVGKVRSRLLGWTLHRMLTIPVVGTEDRRLEHRLPDACSYGLGRRRAHRHLRWPGEPSHRHHQAHKARSWCSQLSSARICSVPTVLLYILRYVLHEFPALGLASPWVGG
jgi:hypothetical protein